MHINQVQVMFCAVITGQSDLPQFGLFSFLQFFATASLAVFELTCFLLIVFFQN